jgi:serine/threonine protein kinase/outer membrane protein assembly factor BamD (BamD/ComL family)
MDAPRAGRISEMEGQRLGPYQLVEMIGRGGMAVVYKALQPTLRRYVAIKVLPGYFVHDEGFRTRFQNEAETVAHLEHPNILPIYDFGQEGDVPYIVMPLVTGGTLRDWLSQSVPLERALAVFSRVLAALEYAHSQRVIHRDIKPSNILMSQGDWPLLTDFGIAKIVEPTLRVTRSGTMLGTPEYMAPEQSQAGVVDQRADLYAMGIILYEMLTGRLPFEGQTPVAIILQHVRDEVPPPSTVNPRLAPIWDQVIQRCLAKTAAERYSSALTMDEAIQATWQRVRRESGEYETVARPSANQLFDSAQRALGEGDWQRVISLCGQLLEVEPAHPEAVRLLTQAHEALRRRQSDQQRDDAQRLLGEGDTALAAERFADAVRAYTEALRLVPDLTAATEGLQRVQHAQSLADLYHAARADIAAEKWDAAAARLDRLASVAPDYHDVGQLREFVAAQRQREAQLAGWYAEGTAARERRDWAGAIAAYHTIVTAAPGYRDAAARLAEAYDGQQRETTAPPAGRPDETVAGARGDWGNGPVADGATAIGNRTAPSPWAGAGAPGGATQAGNRAPEEITQQPATVGPSVAEPPAPPRPVPVATPQPAPAGGGGMGRRLAIAAAVLVALGIGAFVLHQVIGPGPGPSPTPTAVVTLTPAGPTATPAPTAADLFATCDSAVKDERWTDAATACERVRAAQADYDGLADALAKTYVALGKQALDAKADLDGALDNFGKALAARPDDAEADQQRIWAQSYKEGDAALANENWPEATDKLEALYAVAPNYLESSDSGGVKKKLYQARLGWGQALLKDGSYADALRRCRGALELVPDSGEAADCQAVALAALATPTPVRVAPTVAPAPAPPRPAPTSAPAPAPAPPRPASTTAPAPPRPAPTSPPAPAPTAVRPAPAPPTRPPAPAPAPPPTRPPQ